jgi:hypothetical protein
MQYGGAWRMLKDCAYLGIHHYIVVVRKQDEHVQEEK